MFFNLLTLSVPDATPGCFSIFWLWAYLTLLQDVFQSFDLERTWRYSGMLFNLLTLSVPDVTPGCFSIFWLCNLLTIAICLSLFRFNGCSFSYRLTYAYHRSRSWFCHSNHLGVFPGSGQFSLYDPPWGLRIHRNLEDVFQSFDFECTWRYSRMFFILLTLSVPDVTPGCFSIFSPWAYLTLLQDVV
jgi:hypothetical protein